MIKRLLERPEGKMTPEHILGSMAKHHARLLQAMFPPLTGEDERDVRGNRLCRRRNLIRALYLGDPPGSFAATDVWKILRDRAEDVALRLRAMIESGDLAEFLDRFEDALEEITAEESANFWIGLSKALLRPTDWIRGPEPERSLADEAQQILLRLGARSESRIKAKLLFDTLIASGDLMIAPGFLRRNMFQHGLTVETSSQSGEPALTAEETREALKTEAPRYKKAILDGFALRKLTDVEPFFVLINGGLWDDELRAGMTEQLSAPLGVETFAGMFIPPGFIVEQKTLDLLFDTQVILDSINRWEEDGSFSQDKWIQTSIRRLKLTLEGKDPHFHRD